ncbi:MAG: hypothetical protein IPO83_05800 [Chitinophagaceae bacterium]|nr:hypothetical protein [Chitinophagaceae bacterium]
MQKEIRLITVGLVLFASQSFAQLNHTTDVKVEPASTAVVSDMSNTSHIQRAPNGTVISKSRLQHRRQLRAEGLSGKAYRHELHERVHAQNVAKKEARMQQRSRRAEHHQVKSEMHEKRMEHARHREMQMQAHPHSEHMRAPQHAHHR